MRITKDVVSVLYIALFSLLVLFCCVATKLFFIPSLDYSGPWRGYHIFAFPVEEGAFMKESEEGDLSTADVLPEERREQIIDIFSAYGYEEIIHRGGERIRYFGFDGQKRVLLAKLSSHIDPQDPLYDKYMRSVGQYFTGRVGQHDAEIIYVESKKAAALHTAALKRAFDEAGIEYRSSVSSPRARLLSVLIFSAVLLFFSFVIFVTGRRNIFLFLSGGLPLASGLPTASFALLSSSVLLLAGWAVTVGAGGKYLRQFLEIRSSRSYRDLRRILIIYMLWSASSFLLVAVAQPGTRIQVAFHQAASAAAQVSIAALWYGFNVALQKRRVHVLFYPTGIKRMGPLIPPMLRNGAMVVLVCMAASPFLYSRFTGEDELYAAAPLETSVVHSGERQEEVHGFSWSTLESFVRSGVSEKGVRFLPDISDYVAHRAYQHGYFYGRDYGFPGRGEEIRITGYERDGNSISSKENVVKMFTEKWYEAIIGEAYKNGVTRLLLSQKGPLRVEKRNIRLLQIEKQTTWGHIAVYMIMSLVLFIMQRRNTKQQALSRENSAMRKGRKVA